jgi:glycine/D-amino acid oxidase-like deaminating enzyme
MSTDCDVIVVGGGLAGLAAGATAAASGARTLVLEAHQPGGRARTTERQRFLFNQGGHALYAGGPGMRALRSLGLHPRGSKPPLSRYRLLIDGEQHVMPSGPATLVRTTALTGRSKAQYGKLLALLPGVNTGALEGSSVSEWVAGHGLRPDAEAVIRALFRLTTYAADLDHLGADAAVAQLQLAAKAGVIYLDEGWAQLVEGLSCLVDVRAGVAARSIDAAGGRVGVQTDDGVLTARSVVVAVGTPDAARALLPGDPGWGDLGEPVTAACLDVGASRVPSPGYVLGVNEPLYGTTQSPPARQAPDGQAVVAIIRYQARSAAEDRPQLEGHLSEVGVADSDVATSRFLARMVVSGALPRADLGGLPGRPGVIASGLPGTFLAGDWVGAVGLLADASLASAQEAARAALRWLSSSATMVA